MITEERMKALFREANPIPDPDSLDTDSPDSTAYLATLKQRSSNMTRTRHEPRADTTNGTKKHIWLIAAVAILILGVVGFLTWPDSENSVADEPSLTPEEETIQQLLSTRDYTVLEGLVTNDWLSTDVEASLYPNLQELMEGAWANEQILGVDRSLDSCEPVSENAFSCTTSYTDDVMKALGEPPIVETTTFTFVEGKVATGRLAAQDHRSGFSQYASANGLQQEFLDACNDPTGRSCMQFIMDNLEGWAIWETGQ